MFDRKIFINALVSFPLRVAVTPAKAGVQQAEWTLNFHRNLSPTRWIPAFAGMTIFLSVLIGIIFTFCLHDAWAMGQRPPKNMDQMNEGTKVTERTLLDCYELALKRSETIAISKEGIEETEAEFLKAAGEFVGDVDYKMTSFRQDPLSTAEGGGGDSGISSNFFKTHRRERKWVFTQPLFQGFKSFAAIAAAGALRKQRTEEWSRAEELLFQDVAQAFYNVLRQKQDLEIVESIIKSYQDRIGDLTEHEKIGRSRESELAKAVSQMKSIESELAKVRGLFAISGHVLGFLTGIEIKSEELKDIDLPDERALELLDYVQASEERSDVNAAKYASKIARQGIIEAQSDLWPQLTLDSNVYNKRDGSQFNVDWDVLFSLNFPLGKGGTTLGNLKEAVSIWKQSKHAYSLTKRQAVLDIQEAYENWIASSNQGKALEEAREASQNSFDLQKAEYDKNLVSNLDVLDALNELYDTSRKANDIYYQMKENYWKLKVAIGEVP
jgi:outer membrane protein TolC